MRDVGRIDIRRRGRVYLFPLEMSARNLRCRGGVCGSTVGFCRLILAGPFVLGPIAAQTELALPFFVRFFLIVALDFGGSMDRSDFRGLAKIRRYRPG